MNKHSIRIAGVGLGFAPIVAASALAHSGHTHVVRVGNLVLRENEQKPIMVSSPLTMFNGGVKGRKTTIFIHAFITVPVPAAIVTAVKITPILRGHYGIHTVSKIPVIAGGAGSVTEFKLRIDRKFTYKGKKKSFLTASCPTGRHFFKGCVLFDDDTLFKITRVLPCTPMN